MSSVGTNGLGAESHMQKVRQNWELDFSQEEKYKIATIDMI